MLTALRRIAMPLAFVLLTVLLCLFAYHGSSRSAARSLHQSLSPTLPARLEAAFRYQLDTEADNLVIDTINDNLASLRTRGTPGILDRCTAQLKQLDGSPQPRGVTARDWRGGKHRLVIGWQHAGAQRLATIHMQCAPDTAILLASQAPLSGALLVLLFWLPTQWQRRIPWWSRAMRQHPDRPLAALRAALAADQMTFDPQRFQVTIHGIDITLPGTPFLYYLWYAERRMAKGDHEGWYFNPPANRADHRAAGELQTLMQQHGGHSKAINDLARQGLRARVLDQNRNRIKEELSAVLGERLAAPWLFEARRDPASQRHAYRLAAPPERIRTGGDPGDRHPPPQSDVPAPE